MPEGKLETDGRSADRFYSCKPQSEAGTGWNGLRVSDPLGGQEACWEDLTEDETRLLKLAADMEHTEVAWIHLQDLIEDLLD